MGLFSCFRPATCKQHGNIFGSEAAEPAGAGTRDRSCAGKLFQDDGSEPAAEPLRVAPPGCSARSSHPEQCNDASWKSAVTAGLDQCVVEVPVEDLLEGVSHLQFVAAGGMGLVFSGAWSSSLVCVKIMASSTLKPNSPAFREIYVCSRARHPNIVQTFQCRVAQVSEPFLKGLSTQPKATAASSDTFLIDDDNTARTDGGSWDLDMGHHGHAPAHAHAHARPPKHPSQGPDHLHCQPILHRADSFGHPCCSRSSTRGEGSESRSTSGSEDLKGILKRLRVKAGQYVALIIMEYCERGSLAHWAHQKLFVYREGGTWPWRYVHRALLRTAMEVAQGMAFLHDLGILHGDLKPLNCLVRTSCKDKRGFTVLLTDFGLAKMMRAAEPAGAEAPAEAAGPAHLGPPCHGGLGAAGAAAVAAEAEGADHGGVPAGSAAGAAPGQQPGQQSHEGGAEGAAWAAGDHCQSWATLPYMAPECFQGHFSKASDVYAFGIMLQELYTGKKPFEGVDPARLHSYVRNRGLRPLWPVTAPPALVALASRCWAQDPAKRPTFHQILDELRTMEEDLRECFEQAKALITTASLNSFSRRSSWGTGSQATNVVLSSCNHTTAASTVLVVGTASSTAGSEGWPHPTAAAPHHAPAHVTAAAVADAAYPAAPRTPSPGSQEPGLQAGTATSVGSGSGAGTGGPCFPCCDMAAGGASAGGAPAGGMPAPHSRLHPHHVHPHPHHPQAQAQAHQPSSPGSCTQRPGHVGGPAATAGATAARLHHVNAYLRGEKPHAQKAQPPAPHTPPTPEELEGAADRLVKQWQMQHRPSRLSMGMRPSSARQHHCVRERSAGAQPPHHATAPEGAVADIISAAPAGHAQHAGSPQARWL